MVFTIKTLIIFDTNALRHVLRLNKNGNAKDVVYHAFEFGLPFKAIESYLVDNGLSDFVELAIPRIALDELKRQKSRSYSSDIETFREIYSLLSQMPYANKRKLELPDSDFDYQIFLEQIAGAYLLTKKVRLIEMPDDNHLKEVFQRIVIRALNTQPPFKKYGEHSDVGFKDALIWESILSYPHLSEFDKVILLTGDNGFSEDCIKEFQDVFTKYLSIQKSEGDVTNELAKDYEEYIENHELIKFTKTDYFKSHLESQISGKSVMIDTQTCPILRFEILNPSESVKTIRDSEQNEEYQEVNSKLKVIYIKNQIESELILVVSTLLDETKNVIDVYFDKEVVEQ